jgi:ribosome-binding factor A
MNNKIERVDSEIMRELSNILAYEIKDPRLCTMISVTGVNTAKDLKTAKVYVSIFDENTVKESLNVLNGASGYIRKLLFDRLKIRLVPYLTFIADTSVSQGCKIDKILRTLNIKSEEENNADE